MTTKIDSLSTFISELQNTIGEQQKDDAFFYRGHINASWNIVPAAYRKIDEKTYLNKEFCAYQEMLVASPSDFSNDKTPLEQLIRMQHYGLPTRLLDVTQNPLVALYFACRRSENDEDNAADASLLIFKLKSRDITYPASIPDAAFAGVLQELSLNDFISKKHILFSLLILEILQRNSSSFDFPTSEQDLSEKLPFDFYLFKSSHKSLSFFFLNINNIKNALWLIKDFNHLKALIGETLFFPDYKDDNGSSYPYTPEAKKQLALTFIDNFQKDYYPFCLAHSWLGLMEPNNIKRGSWISAYIDDILSYSKIYFVKSPLNNERIKNQQGAFLLFAPLQHFAQKSPDHLDQYKIERLIIPAENKPEIIKELATFGITENFLFPDLAVQAKHIKNKIYEP